ncbi:MAG: response regulator [Verrucomicrobia bacterium]|nr:response regulator [Verrucomicrobiota bacterium]
MSSKKTVLLADDELIHLVSYRDYLEDAGFRVIAVEDALGVEKHFGEARALVVDARLPTARLEGLEVVAKLLRDGTLEPTVAVIFISVHSEDDDVCQQKFKDLFKELPQLKGRYVWLQKHFELEMLLKTIEDELARRQGYLGPLQ